MAATEKPSSATLTTAQLQGPPAWKRIPTWYLISGEDQFFDPTAQRQMAQRAAPPDRIDVINSSHASMWSHPEEVAQFIEKAAPQSNSQLQNQE